MQRKDPHYTITINIWEEESEEEGEDCDTTEEEESEEEETDEMNDFIVPDDIGV